MNCTPGCPNLVRLKKRGYNIYCSRYPNAFGPAPLDQNGRGPLKCFLCLKSGRWDRPETGKVIRGVVPGGKKT